MSVAVIFNPTSGGGKGKKVANRFRQYLTDRSLESEFVETSLSHNLKDRLNSLSGIKTYVVIGGDGSIYDMVNAMEDYSIPLGILPAGTGNDFVNMIAIGDSETERFETAINGKIRKIDVGDCNGKKFLNGVGIGFDGQIVAAMQNKKKWLSGQAAYYYEVLRILSTYKEKAFNFSLDEHTYQKDLILLTIGNGSTFGGGFKLTPYANITDGLLNICEIGKISALNRYLNLLKLQNGTHDRMSAVQMYEAKTITISENPLLNAHIDGEFLGNPPFHIQLLPLHLSIKIKED